MFLSRGPVVCCQELLRKVKMSEQKKFMAQSSILKNFKVYDIKTFR